MVESLSGQVVWVTRPKERARALCERITQAGGVAYNHPVMTIQAISGPALDEPLERIRAQKYRGVIFASGFAAELSLPLLHWDATDPPRIFAIGSATQTKIKELGFKTQGDTSGRDFTSEGLLATPELTNVSGESWLLVKGKDGRTLLKDTLVERGARVDTLNVYQRQPAAALPQELLDRLKTGQIRFVTVTSVDILNYMLDLLGTDGDCLETATLIAPSYRVCGYIRRALPNARFVQAQSATDQDMVMCMIKSLRHKESNS